MKELRLSLRTHSLCFLAAVTMGAPTSILAATAARISLTPGVITTAAGSSSNGASGLGNGGAATSAALFNPASARFDGAGNLYILDAGNMVIRKVIGAGLPSAGIIVPFAGTGVAGSGGDGGQASGANFSSTARGLYVSATGIVWISDSGNNAVRKIDANGVITTVAGTLGAPAGYTGDGGAATTATLNNPGGIYVDAAGNLYIADTGNNVVRVVNVSGVIRTFAGGSATVCQTPSDSVGDGCPIAQSILLAPADVWGDAAGNLDILDAGDFRVRKANATTGLITSIVGTGIKGTSGDGAAATAATFGTGAAALSLDSTGNLFIADTGNSKIRMVTLGGIISTVAGNGTAGYAGDGVGSTAANLNLPMGVTVDSSNNVYIADTQNSRIREVFVNAGIIAAANSVINTVSATSVLTVMNTGTAPLTFTGITIGAPFSEKSGVSTDCKTTASVAVGATCTLTLLYTPTTIGVVNGVASLQSNASNASTGAAIQLYGAGVAAGTTATITTLTTSLPGVPTIAPGQSVTFTATVAPGTGVNTIVPPTGSIQFTSGVAFLGSVALTPSPTSTNSSVATFATTTLAAGIDPVIATYTGDATFKTSASTAQTIGVFTGTMDFTVAPSVAALTVANGSSGTLTLNVASVNGYANTVGFQCANLPPSASCTFSPFTTFIQAGKQSTPNITVTLSFPLPLSKNENREPWRPVGGIALAVMLCGGVALRKKGMASLPTLLLVVMSVLSTISLSGCSSAPAQPSLVGSYNVSIVASDGVTSHTVIIPVTVQ